jgi:hypothetical protein
VSARSCLAVGDTGFPQDFWTGGKAAAIRWDGRTWKATTIPAAPKRTRRIFYSVSCLSAAACVAVGQQEAYGSPYADPVSGFWNGTRWKLILAQ